jgi:hypothetical protein
MLTVILKRNSEVKEIQLTQYNLINDMWQISGAELLTEDSWAEGLKKVRTPFVCLVEGDSIFSDNNLFSSVELMTDDGHNIEKGTGGYLKLAAVSPAVSSNRRHIYYKVEGNEVYAIEEHQAVPYSAQIGFIPGAILRYSSIKDDINTLPWDEPNLVKMSSIVSLYLWNTNRRIKVNPDLTYISTYQSLEVPCLVNLPAKVKEVFERERL